MIKLRFVVPVLACLALVGCGAQTAEQKAPAQQAATDQAPATSAAPASGGTPTEQQKQAFVTALGAVDPSLVTKPDRAVSRGREVCLEITQAKPDATVVSNAAQRFDVDQAKAQKIVDAAKQSLCTQ